jgi:glutaredoxin
VTAPAQPRVVLYGRSGCHLCDEARALVARVCGEMGVPWAEVDVDDPPAPGVADPFDAYGERVPVVAVDGVDVAQWQVSERTLRAALA